MRLFDLFRPTQKNGNQEQTASAVQNISDKKENEKPTIQTINKDAHNETINQATLKERALKKDDEWVDRMMAVNEITDETTLREVALTDESMIPRKHAVEKMTNEVFLKEVVLRKEEIGFIRRIAIEKIVDETFLKKVALEEEDIDIRLNAVEKINDERFLKEIALKDPEKAVRKKAVEKITDEAFLKEIEMSDSKIDTRMKIVEASTDEIFLKETALHDIDSTIRSMAIEKITNEALLKEIILNSSDNEVQCKIIKKTTNEAFLKELSLSHSNVNIRLNAVEKITDEKVLIEIALNDSDKYVRISAVEKITDETVLKKVALNDSNGDVRWKAVKKINDETFLREVATNDSYKYVRQEANEKLSRQLQTSFANSAPQQASPLASPVKVANQGFYERDNRGMRVDDMGQSTSYWLIERTSSPRKDPFVYYVFKNESDARAALLDLPFIHAATDTGNLICDELFRFGYFAVTNNGQLTGEYDAFVAGADFTHDMWEKTHTAFASHNGMKKNDLEPDKNTARKYPSSAGNARNATFVRENRDGNSTWMTYKAPSKADAMAFLSQQQITRPLYYVVVETPEGNFGKDKDGFY